MHDSAPQSFCPHAERCGGCDLIHVPYGEQLTRKRATLARALAPYPELSQVEVPATVAAEPTRQYRVRAKLVASGSALGLFARGGHEVVDIPECRVQSPRVLGVSSAVRERMPFEFELSGVDVREVDAGVLVTLIVPEDAESERVLDAAQRLRAAHPDIVTVAVSRRARGSVQLLGGRPTPLVGPSSAPHRLHSDGPYHLAAPGAFVQAHAGQALTLHRSIEEALQYHFGSLEGLEILELYAGSGALALELSARGASVTACDSFLPAIQALLEAARAQRLALSAHAVTAEAALARSHPARAVIVDPPRRGLSPDVRVAIARRRPELVLYVSCSPATLARDLAHLRRLGFAVESARPIDMIPLSSAVETLAVLVPDEPPAPRVLYEDEALVAVDKPAFVSTTPQGEHTDSLLARLRAMPGLANAVPVHRLDIGTSGVCLFARSPQGASVLSAALTAGNKSYLALVRGIIRPKGKIDRPLRDGRSLRDAVTRYRRERVVGTHSLVRAMPAQGRQHQIRRHLASINHPVLGDERHGDPASNRYFAEQHGLDRSFLHAARIELVFGERSLIIDSPLAPDLSAVLESLEGKRGSSE